VTNWRDCVKLASDDTSELIGERVSGSGWCREQFRLTQCCLELPGGDVAQFPPVVRDVCFRTAYSEVGRD